MNGFLEFARGPLFVATFLFMVLGLSRHVLLRTLAVVSALRRTPKKDVPWKKVFRKTAGWVVPVQHVYRAAPVLSVASILFHIAILVVPVFLADHVFLWARGVGITLPALGAGTADFLSMLAILSGTFLFLFRVVNRTARDMSGFPDYALLVVVVVPFLTGWFAAHPESSPLAYPTMMLLHVLSAELTFVLLPFTKLAHVVLYFFDRISTDIFWRFVPGAGDKVAEALRGTTKGAEA